MSDVSGVNYVLRDGVIRNNRKPGFLERLPESLGKGMLVVFPEIETDRVYRIMRDSFFTGCSAIINELRALKASL